MRAPPFFRTSAGHRVEGRNPWHLQCSRNQLRAGIQFRRLVRSLSLRPSWLLASWADQTEPRLSLPKASTSGLPALKSPRGLPDMTTAPNGELRRQDLHLQVQQLVSLRSLPWVAWVSLPHLHWYYATLRLPSCPSRVASLVARVPIPCVLPCVCGLPCGLVSGWKPREHARAFGHPVPHSGLCVKETDGSPKFPSSPSEDMPRSQTPVVSCALAVAHPGLLPSSACKPSASHNVTHFGAQSHGLPSRYTRLRTAPYGEARGFATDLLARR